MNVHDARSEGGLLGVNLNAANNWPFAQGDPDLFWISFASPRHTTRTVAD